MLGGDPLRHPEPLIRRVYSYVAYRVGDGPDAEDITNDAFERALRYRDTYDRKKGTPQAWLLGIARTCVAEYFGQRDPGGASAPDPGTGHDLERDAVQRVTIQSAIARLGDRDRELIALRYGADLKVREIAELLGERTNTIEVALHRALERLRQDLATPTAPGEPRTQLL
jgi:RNA polymerase sigma factor (sigma-70 family)